MNVCITNYAPDDNDYPDECLDEIVFGCPKPLPRLPVMADTIAIVGISPRGVRVVLTATRIVYAGKWKQVPDWIDYPPSYRAEFELLARHMRRVQIANEVRVYEMCGKGN